MIKNCLICNKEFITYPNKIKRGYGKYCSNNCRNIGHKKYKPTLETLIKLRESHLGKKSGFKNKKHSQKSIMIMKKTWFKKRERSWIKENKEYLNLHKWINESFGKPTKCEHCGKDGLTGKQIHWASINHTYKKRRKDWKRLCVKCHWIFDNFKSL